MKNAVQKFYEYLNRPLHPRARLGLAILVIPLVFALFYPLWRIGMVAPQYREGLTMDIYAHTVEGGHDGADIKEINILNHYIGMKKIDRGELSDLDWLPFAIGGLALLTLRVAAIGNVRSLVDVAVLATYFSGFAMARFVYRLWVYGHTLDPDAPVKVEGFMPAMLGTKQIANFTTSSYPMLGSYLLGAFITGVGIIAIAELVIGRREAARAEAAASA